MHGTKSMKTGNLEKQKTCMRNAWRNTTNYKKSMNAWGPPLNKIK